MCHKMLGLFGAAKAQGFNTGLWIGSGLRRTRGEPRCPAAGASKRPGKGTRGRQRQVMRENPQLIEAMWRPHVLGKRGSRADPDQKRSMLFARVVPGVFAAAWAVPTVVALVLPFRR